MLGYLRKRYILINYNLSRNLCNVNTLIMLNHNFYDSVLFVRAGISLRPVKIRSRSSSPSLLRPPIFDFPFIGAGQDTSQNGR